MPITNTPKVYVAASVRGEPADRDAVRAIIAAAEKHGTVLTKHLADPNPDDLADQGIQQDSAIHDRDMDWLESADVVIAEVTASSLGVGYEIATAVHQGKRPLCLYSKVRLARQKRRVSAMIAGSPGVRLVGYLNAEDAAKHVTRFLSEYAAARVPETPPSGTPLASLDAGRPKLSQKRSGGSLAQQAAAGSAAAAASSSAQKQQQKQKKRKKQSPPASASTSASLEVVDSDEDDGVSPPPSKKGKPSPVSLPAAPAASEAPEVPEVEAPPALLSSRVRSSHSQTIAAMNVTVYAKNVPKEDVVVEFAEQALRVKVTLADGSSWDKTWNLWAPIVPEKCSYTSNAFKITIALHKLAGAEWKALDTESAAAAESSAAIANPYSGAARDWEGLAAKAKEEESGEKKEGDAALMSLFQTLYSAGDEDTKRAMVKSFQTSGGTVLSTNWKEVDKSDYESEIKPPDGQEVHKWGQGQ